MDIKVLAQEENYIELELTDEEQGFANALRELLINDKNVEFAAYRVDHPQLSPPRLMVRTKSGSPLAAIKDAVKKLKKFSSEFNDEIKSAKKPAESRKKK